jgi:vacuolar protein sorting-associated protein 35
LHCGFLKTSAGKTANSTRNIYPERLDYIDQVLTFANKKVGEYQNSADLHSQATQSQILSLLLSPIKTYISLFTALALPNFIPLLNSQPYPTRRAVAGEVARSLMRNHTYITSVENLESSLEILKVLIREGIQQAQGYPGGPIQRRAQETEETIEEQGWLARIVHLIRGADNDTQFKVSVCNWKCHFLVTNESLAPPSSPQSFLRRQRARQIHYPGHNNSVPQACAAIQEA